MTFFPIRITGLILLFQALLLLAGPAKEPGDRSHLFAAQVEEVLAGLKDTKYQSKTVVDPKNGVFRCNCSGLISHILRNHFPESYLTVRGTKAPWKVRPLAVTFYETFMAAGENSATKPGWRKVPKMMEVKPGDIIAWRKLSLIQGLNTGHVCMIAGFPTLEEDGRVRVRIVDSTSGRHFNDTRPKGVKGVGAGEMWFAINDAGEPIGYWMNEKSKRSKTNKIAVGRLVPIKVSGALHPQETIVAALVGDSEDLDFVGLSADEAVRLADKRNIEHRIIVENGSRKAISKILDDERVNFVVKDGKVLRTIRG